MDPFVGTSLALNVSVCFLIGCPSEDEKYNDDDNDDRRKEF